MPVTVLWAAKGGSGTTVVTASLALSCRTDSLLVDLAGDLPAALGIADHAGPGVGDWVASDAPASALGDLTIEVGRSILLLPRGAPIDPTSRRWPELVDWLTRRPAVYIDAGTGEPPPCLVDGEVRNLLVARACYVGLQRAIAMRCRPDGVVLVAEPGRALRRSDVERSTGAPVVATVSLDVAVARAVDAGLIRSRLPHLLQRELRACQPTERNERRPTEGTTVREPGGDAGWWRGPQEVTA